MNKLQLSKELKRIGDRNRRFNAMTLERKRVTIAKDTLASLQAKKFIASHGVGYLHYSSTDNGDKLPNNYKCGACALGGMFVGLTTRIKELSIKEQNGDRDRIIAPLRSYFDREQLDAIEYAFEQGNISLRTLNYSSAHRYSDFGKAYDNPDDRLIAIMQNIIDNKGTFTP